MTGVCEEVSELLLILVIICYCSLFNQFVQICYSSFFQSVCYDLLVLTLSSESPPSLIFASLSVEISTVVYVCFIRCLP